MSTKPAVSETARAMALSPTPSSSVATSPAGVTTRWSRPEASVSARSASEGSSGGGGVRARKLVAASVAQGMILNTVFLVNAVAAEHMIEYLLN